MHDAILYAIRYSTLSCIEGRRTHHTLTWYSVSYTEGEKERERERKRERGTYLVPGANPLAVNDGHEFAEKVIRERDCRAPRGSGGV